MPRHCIHCGKPLKENNKFCTHCGKSINVQAEEKSRYIIPEKPHERTANEIMEERLKATIIIRLRKDFLEKIKNPIWTKLGIHFWQSIYLTEGILPPMIPYKNIADIFRIINKYPNYMVEKDAITSIEVQEGKRVSSGKTILPWARGNYLSIIATRKGNLQMHEKEIGYLLYVLPDKCHLLGVEIDNAFYFKGRTEKEIQNLVINDLKLLLKPNLWTVVLVLMGQPLTENQRSVAELSAKMSKLTYSMGDFIKKTQKKK